jgi:signal transduction histidine kinase
MSVDSSTLSSQQLDPGLRNGSLATGGASAPVAGWRKEAAGAFLVAVAYFAGTRIGFTLTPRDMPIGMFWPPNAILLAALVLAPVRVWWMILLALIPAHFAAQLPTGVPVATAFGWLLGNAGEALLGAALLSRVARRDVLFQSLRGVTCFLLCAFILAPLVSSFLDAAIVVGTNWGSNYWLLWTTRCLSNMLAQLTIVPWLVVAGSAGWSWVRDVPWRTWVEAAVLAAAIVVVSIAIFGIESPSRTSIPALIYLPLPLLLWAAMRFGPAGLSASLLAISVIAIQGVMHGRGPFIAVSPAAGVLSMQVFLCMIGVPLLILASTTNQRRQAEQSLREMSRKLIDAQEGERRHIARELHDGIGQTLALAELELDRVVAHATGDPSKAALYKVRDRLTMVSQGLWEVSHGLYPSNLEYVGLVRALSRICQDLHQETSLKVHYDTDGVPDQLPDDVSLCLFRVTQGALQNVVRHSHASNVSVRLRGAGGRLWLRIQDDGVGFSRPAAESRLGFASIRERLKALDGDFEVDSAPGRGTRLEAWVTFRPSSAPAEIERAVHDAAITE